MPHHRVAPESLAGRGHAPAPAFECSWRDGGLNAAWVHLAGELDVDRLFALTGNTRYVEDGGVSPVDPSVQALLRLGDTDGAS
jgi:hypothetical protein